MQRSSDSIASLAAALAKAQIELANPEKSLIGSIEAKHPNAPERLFRYASLASGLDIVRKTLGQHEIATVQTTAIDQAAGTVNLTTVLAHASGEWISSDWPVCPISETATPHRMGAALTYARRYALFTLVGIAGEDDLDAPDLMAPANQAPGPNKAKENGIANGRLNSRPHTGPQRPTVQRNGKPQLHSPPAPMLHPEASAQLRDRLIAELNGIGTGDDAAIWAHRRLAEKNTLTATDAARVEESFRVRLASFTTPVADASPAKGKNAQLPAARASVAQASEVEGQSNAVDKSVLTLSEPRRVRDREHVRYVAQQTCLVCGRRPCDAHHLRFAQSRALGRKVSDEFTVPLCRGHHREVHRHGDEAAWWHRAAIDPAAAARSLWLETHPRLAEANTAPKAVIKRARPGRKKPELRNEANLTG
jgi:hypothetical protein